MLTSYETGNPLYTFNNLIAERFLAMCSNNRYGSILGIKIALEQLTAVDDSMENNRFLIRLYRTLRLLDQWRLCFCGSHNANEARLSCRCFPINRLCFQPGPFLL